MMKPVPIKSGVIVTHEDVCHGCGICELVCSLSHNGVCGPSLSRINLLRDPLTGEFLLKTCKQCNYPDCYFSCSVEAIYLDESTGARVIDLEKCVNCGVCANSCPYNEEGDIIKIHTNQDHYIKCDLCSSLEREPICVEACPWGALTYLPKERR
jgi:Fe-S-cluster-containing hydrogenase component 2